MHTRLTTKSIFHHWQTPVMLLAFFGIRATSFFLVSHMIIQGILVFFILMLLAVLYFKNPTWAWYLLIGELFLGGAGHYLEFIHLSVRTLVIGTFLILWTLDNISEGVVRKKTHFGSYPTTFLLIFYLLLTIAVINGLSNGHPLANVIQDLVPFLYLPLVFPAFHLLSRSESQEYFVRLVIAFLIGSAVFSIFTYLLFSSGVVHLQELYYKWFRDVALGRVTDMGNNFFRIVLPSHLLIAPIILVISSLLMRDEKHHKMWRFLLILGVVILVLDLSRIYLLALLVGLIVLKYKHRWHRWLIISSTTLGLVILIFSSFFIVSSGGETLGWELFGVRIASLAAPQIETSSALRLMILPAAVDLIKGNPILGQGLGASITFRNTKTYDVITTRQFDWGYLEMLVELGILGTLAFLTLIFFVMHKLIQKIKHASDWHDFYVGLLGAIVAMLVTNITSPALFHVFGIILLILTMAIAAKPNDIFERVITTLYRIFNRLKNISGR